MERDEGATFVDRGRRDRGEWSLWMARDDSDREVREVLMGQLQPLTVGPSI